MFQRASQVVLLAHFLAVSSFVYALNASITSQSVPTNMVAGQAYEVSIMLFNNGEEAWDPAALVRLGSQNPENNMTWGIGRVELPGIVNPGVMFPLDFVVTAPSSPGIHNFQWRMLQENVIWFGEFSPNVAVTVSAPTPPQAATFVSQTVPTTMVAGQNYAVSVTMQNTGTETWTPQAAYRLGSQSVTGSWGVPRIDVPTAIAPGANVTFNFNITAPTTPGSYTTKWRMLQEGVAWFGDFTPEISVTVSQLSDTTPPSVPTGLTATPGVRQIALTWNASIDNVSPNLSYTLERCSGTPSICSTFTMGNTSFTDRMLLDGTAYTYRIKATDPAGNSSAFSDAVTATTPPPANTPPTVTLTAPANNATYTAPATISLTATASDTDGTITQVEFFQGTTLLATDTNGADGYSYTWNNVPQGSYTLTAKATDNAGATTFSGSVSITVSGAAFNDALLHWSFDNGTATDSSPNANSGSLIGAPSSVPGQVNLALNFNGTNEGVSLNTVNSLPSGNTPHTIAAWIMIDSLPANRAWLLLLGQEGGGAHHWLINNNGLTQLGVWEGNQLQPTLTAGIWQHLAMSFDGTNLTGYINGTAIGSTPASFNLQGLPLTLAASHIGENYFNGTIDELKIYDRALSATEVSALASTAPPPANTPPTVTLTAPANNASYTAPATVNLTAAASDTDGTITQVEFFQGTTLLATDTTGADGYSYTWTNVPQGSYSLTAKATDNLGAVTTSSVVSVLVNAAGSTSDTVWVDDTTPAGATLGGTNEDWNWSSVNPTPNSGSLAHPSALLLGLHQHYFYGATSTLSINPGDTLFAYVYLNPANPPTEVMLEWNDGSAVDGGWDARAYWGANTIGWGIDGTPSRRYMGPLPALGQWVKLAVPASLVNLEGKILNGMAFTLVDGQATWDSAGKTTTGSGNTPPTVTLTSPTNNSTYEAPATINLTATASDNDGIDKVEFYSGTTLIATDSNGADGYNATWTHVPTDTSNVFARATDNSGAVRDSNIIALAILPSSDTTPPSVPTGLTATPGVRQVALTWIASTDNVSTTLGYHLEQCYGVPTVCMTVILTGATNYTYVALEGDSTFIYRVKAVDQAGNSSGYSNSVSATTLTTPPNPAPTVSLSSNGTTFAAPASFTLTATASDDGSINRVEFFSETRSDGFVTGTNFLCCADNSAPYNINLSGYLQGTYYFFARAFDNLNASSDSNRVTITVGPGSDITPPTIPSGLTATPGVRQIALTWSASTDNVSTYIGYSLERCSGTPSICSGFLLSGTSFTDIGLTDGTVYTYRVKATDEAGNSSAFSGAVTATPSAPANTPPTVNLTAPANNATYTAPATVNLTASASDTDGTIAKVEFFQGTTLLAADTNGADGYSYTWVNVPQGSYSLTARATDNLGAVATSAAINVTVTAVSNTPPTVTLSSPINNASFTAPANITISALATDGDGNIAKVEFFAGTTLLNTDTATPYTYTWSGVPAGSYTLIAKATDNSAASASASVNITVGGANTAPSVSITSPANGARFAPASNVIITVNATDSDGITQVDFYAGAQLIGTDTTAPYSIVWSAPAGNHSLTAKATDSLGAVGTSSAIDITVPVEVVTYFHFDLVGSPQAATDEQGRLLWREEYHPYGSRLLIQDYGTNDRWFTGKPYEEDTGLSYFGARSYDPLLGRFMGVDPQGFDEKNLHSFNRYAYGNNNPYKYVDPDGHLPVFFLLLGIGLTANEIATSDVPMIGGGVAKTGVKAAEQLAGKEVSAGAEAVAKGASRETIVIGEGMADRVIPTAKARGANWYDPRKAPPEKWMENNQKWINEKMDQGCRILDCGAAPGRANYPNPTSPYYKMELEQINQRNYPFYERINAVGE